MELNNDYEIEKEKRKRKAIVDFVKHCYYQDHKMTKKESDEMMEEQFKNFDYENNEDVKNIRELLNTPDYYEVLIDDNIFYVECDADNNYHDLVAKLLKEEKLIDIPIRLDDKNAFTFEYNVYFTNENNPIENANAKDCISIPSSYTDTIIYTKNALEKAEDVVKDDILKQQYIKNLEELHARAKGKTR